MGYLVINGHWSRVPFSTWNFLEHNQNSFLGSSWDLYDTIKFSGFQRSPKKSLNRHSIGLRKVSSFRSEFMYSLKSPCFVSFEIITFNPVTYKRLQSRINGGFLRNGFLDLAEIFHAQIYARCSPFLLKRLSCTITFFDRMLPKKKAWESKQFLSKNFQLCADFQGFLISAKLNQPLLRKRRLFWTGIVYSELDWMYSVHPIKIYQWCGVRLDSYLGCPLRIPYTLYSCKVKPKQHSIQTAIDASSWE